MKDYPKKYLGIDHGSVRIGLSFGDSDVRLAVPYDIIEGVSEEEALEVIVALCRDEEIDEMVIGRPISKEGEQTAQNKQVGNFIEALKLKTDLPIIEVDERFSSRMAAKIIGRSDDAVAASIILQTYLDTELNQK